MSERTPFQIAADALTHIFDFPNLVRRNVGYFDCGFPSVLFGKERMYNMHASWTPSAHRLSLELGVNFDLAPLQQGGPLYRMLERSTEPFLPSNHSTGRLGFARVSDGVLAPRYQAEVEYAPLQDEEIEPEFRAALMRGFCMLEFLSPIFSQMELGYLPSAYERVRLISVAYGMWELNTAETENRQRH